MTPGKIQNRLDDDLFDDSAGYDDETGIKFAAGLTTDERKQATALYRLFNELWGVCGVFGDPGTGKDLFGNYLTYKIKTYFPWKKIIRDEKPRRLYGRYDALFNEEILQSDFKAMRQIATGGKDIKDGDWSKVNRKLDGLVDKWVEKEGQVLLKNSVLYLTEWWRYCNIAETNSLMNKTMGGIHKMKRHLDCLVLGTAQIVEDLAKKTCKRWMDWKVTCTRSKSNPTGFVYFVQKVKYDPRIDDFIHIGQPFPISFDAGEPRSDLGDGKIILHHTNYHPVTEEERIVLDVIKAGGDTYGTIVDFIEDYGDMTKAEILWTLKELKFRRSKRAIDYPCWFSLYNSKSAPQLRTKVRVTDD